MCNYKIATVTSYHVFEAEIFGSHARKRELLLLCTIEERLNKIAMLSDLLTLVVK